MFFSFMGRLKRSLIYGIRRDLRPYELVVFERVLAKSESGDRIALRQQFEARERVQRWAHRVLFFGLPPKHALAAVADTRPDHCYASVRLRAPGGEISVKLMTHRGFLSTIEFSRNPLPMLAESFIVQRVVLHPGGTGYADDMDVGEHGPLDTV